MYPREEWENVGLSLKSSFLLHSIPVFKFIHLDMREMPMNVECLAQHHKARCLRCRETRTRGMSGSRIQCSSHEVMWSGPRGTGFSIISSTGLFKTPSGCVLCTCLLYLSIFQTLGPCPIDYNCGTTNHPKA